MSLRGRSYSILIVSAAGSLTSAFADLLPRQGIPPSGRYQASAPPDGRLRQRRMTLLSSIPLCPTTWGVRFAIDLCSSRQSVVLLLVKSDLHNGIHEQVTEYGVFTLSKPYRKQP